jgi:hypothetical protein
MFDFDKAYDEVTDSYLIPREYITKGIKKSIEQVADNVWMAHKRKVYLTSTTHAGLAKYVKEKWGRDRSARIPLDDVTVHMLSNAYMTCYTSNIASFTETIRARGWITLKQFRVLQGIVLRKCSNAAWESDSDEDLSPSYNGLPN